MVNMTEIARLKPGMFFSCAYPWIDMLDAAVYARRDGFESVTPYMLGETDFKAFAGRYSVKILQKICLKMLCED